MGFRGHDFAAGTLRLTYLGALVAGSLGLGGCPQGAELDNPDMFLPYTAARGSVGGTGAGGSAGVSALAGTGSGGTGGAPPTGGAAGTTASGGAGSIGAAGTAPVAGATTGGAPAGGAGSTGGAGATASCDVQAALTAHCALSACHSASDKVADLDLSDAATLASLVGKPASHLDINCDLIGESFVPCTPEETAARCAPGSLVLDGANPSQSWLVKKLTAGGADNCGYDMPVSPGNSVTRGWSDERRACLIQYFTALAASQ